ncbi:hypothetical protein HK101_001036 [Irineochytrium annulatum]|nr:hypothetical protein HK101_001036 [Irineochytrium annulatum]
MLTNKSYTLPFENRKNISRIALAPNDVLLLSIDEDGHGILANFSRKIILHHQNFKEKVHDIQFSPNGELIAITHGKRLQFWRVPKVAIEFSPFVLHRTLAGPYDDVISLKWSRDSRFILAGCRDMTVRVFSSDPIEGFAPSTLTGHRDIVLGAWFSPTSDSIYSVGRDGSLFVWTLKDVDNQADELSGEEEGDDELAPKKKRLTLAQSKTKKPVLKKWTLESRHYFNQNHAKIVSADFHQESGLLVVGFTSGIFGIWELPDFNNIHTLSISQKRIDAVTINPSGDWLAFGCSKLGQLLVWEWKSESYILKQQGHQHEMNCLSYSPDGQYIVTGGDDGKVKLWNTQSGYCFVTFTNHSAGIQAVDFAKKGQVVFSASLDGTIRAFDMVRYRNFRTFTSPTPAQFGCLAVDPSGELVCAGSVDTFEIFIWSVQTGKLLEILSGHEAPISSLIFSPIEGRLVSGSWDRNVKTWDVFSRSMNTESFEHGTEVLALAYRPDGRQIAVATLDGQITMWDIEFGRQVGTIDGRNDIAGGRRSTDRVTAANVSSSQHFTSICYTVDGTCLIAGGNSKYVCIYNLKTSILIKKFQISHNLSLDAMHEELDSRNMTDAGPKDLIDDSGDLSDLEDRLDRSLPGAQKGDLSLRANTKVEARTKGVKFSPTGRTWAAASTEGLLIYSLDDFINFDPFDLEIDITPETIVAALRERDEFLRALIMAFRLGERAMVEIVYSETPHTEIPVVVKSLPQKYLGRLLAFLVEQVDKNPNFHFNLLWCNSVTRYHGQYLKDHSQEFASVLRGLVKAISKIYESLSKVTNENIYSIGYLVQQLKIARAT